MIVAKIFEENKLFNLLIKILFCLLPFLLCVLLIKIRWGMSISNLKPTWGDEVWWWTQAGGMAKYGHPLGVYGYNGSKATIGTFATWGWAAVVPYALFAKIFGWNLYSYFLCNIFYISIANFIFIKLTHPDYKSIFSLSFCNIALILNSLFSTTAMQETCRTAFGIIICACLYKIREQNNKKIFKFFKYFIVPVFLLFAIQMYMIFTVFLFIYLLEVVKKKLDLIKAILLSILLSGIIMISVQKFSALFCAPYISSSNERKLYDNFFVFLNCRNTFFYAFGLLILLVLIALLFQLRGGGIGFGYIMNNENFCTRTSCIILSAFLTGYLFLYGNASAWTMIRGLNIGLCCSLYVLSLEKKKTVNIFCTVLLVVSLFSINSIESTFYLDRTTSQEQRNIMTEHKELFNKYILLNANAQNPWENTVSTFCVTETDTLCLPTGFGNNWMQNGEVNTNAKYCVVGLSLPEYTEMTNEYISKLNEKGWVLLYEDKTITIWKNPKYI